MSKILPMIPSKLLRIAVEDVQKSLNEGHEPDMDVSWLHVVERAVGSKVQHTCYLCMAGAVMLQRDLVRGFDLHEAGYYLPSHCKENALQLTAIDYMRRGLFLDACHLLVPFDLVQHKGLFMGMTRSVLENADADIPGMANLSTYLKIADELEAIGM